MPLLSMKSTTSAIPDSTLELVAGLLLDMGWEALRKAPTKSLHGEYESCPGNMGNLHRNSSVHRP
jgi:hypothetical protein